MVHARQRKFTEPKKETMVALSIDDATSGLMRSKRPKSMNRHNWPLKRLQLKEGEWNPRNMFWMQRRNSGQEFVWWRHLHFVTSSDASDHVTFVKSGLKVANSSEMIRDKSRKSTNCRGLAFELIYFLRERVPTYRLKKIIDNDLISLTGDGYQEITIIKSGLAFEWSYCLR